MKTDYTLFIDTSDQNCSVIRLESSVRTIENKLTNGRLHSQIILRQIEDLFKKNNISLSQIKEIRVSLGPGSFTGIRVGITVAKILSWTLGIPLNSGSANDNLIIKYSESKFD